MLFADASALTAIIASEPNSDDLALKLVSDPVGITSALSVFETTLAVARISRITLVAAETEVSALLRGARIATVDITPEIGRLALDAWVRYGKSTSHPAKLNMGDCFAYACAKAHGAALLYKGDDFVHTDLA